MNDFFSPEVLISIISIFGICLGTIFTWLLSINNRFAKIESNIEINTKLDEVQQSKIEEFISEVKSQLTTIHNDLSGIKQDISAIKASRK